MATCLQCGKELVYAAKGVKKRYCDWRCRVRRFRKFPTPQAYRDYLRWRSYETAVVRFWSFVEKTDYCWNWKGGVSKGYGVFSIAHETTRAHKFSWLLHYGYEAVLQVLHRCDNPICVRPDHLFEGTQRDNIQDAFHKKRMWTQNHDPLRREVCRNGHLMTPNNTYTHRGYTHCRRCRYDNQITHRKLKKETV